ncbi:MAG: hypothetical protein OSB19_02080 [Opitutaceae bacterium]|nr:hypothetical protein [Opitutaceae bacterium]
MKTPSLIRIPQLTLLSAIIVLVPAFLQAKADESQSAIFQKETGKEEAFDLKGKTRERNGAYEFFIPHGEKYTTFALSEEPRQLCARLSEEGTAQMKDLEGLAMGRWRIAGKCIPNPNGKGHIITSVQEIEPLGPGVVYTEDRELTGTLEVLGDPNAKDFLTTSSMHFHSDDGIVYRIPAKKFKLKPSGLSYQQAALFDKKSIRMKARIQIYREQPFRVATVFNFAEAGG